MLVEILYGEYDNEGGVDRFTLHVSCKPHEAWVTGYVGIDGSLRVADMNNADVRDALVIMSDMVTRQGWYIDKIKDYCNK